MDGTELGKIDKVSFGLDGDGRFGLHVSLIAGCVGSSDFKGVWAGERSEYAKWTDEDRREEMAGLCFFLIKLLTDAKKRDVEDLVGTPIEMTFAGNMLKSWRVLTEVL